jgi:hypothetical protein
VYAPPWTKAKKITSGQKEEKRCSAKEGRS